MVIEFAGKIEKRRRAAGVMDRSVSLPNSSGYIGNGDSHQPHLKAARSLGGTSLHRKRVSWVPDIVDNEDVMKKSFKKEAYVSFTASSSNWGEFEPEDTEDQSL